VPSQSFDLSAYKLTLPIDKNGGAGGTNGIEYPAESISNTDLLAGFVDDFFYVDSSGHLVHTAPSNGAVTTPGSGSDHTRSELRELYTGPGADPTNYTWNSNIGGTLTGVVMVNSVSANSDVATFGQIHGLDGPFVAIGYRPAKGTITGLIYPTYTSTKSNIYTLASGYSLNQVIHYSISYSGNTVTFTVDGNTQSFSVDSSWAGTQVYISHGAYHTAPNTGNPAGDQTQVSFLSFSISH
jgi:hypothetical protein